MSAPRPESGRENDVRTEWLRYALSTEPADRASAEAAVSSLYAQLGHPPPEFVWAGSPSAAVSLVQQGELRFDRDAPFEVRLASLAAEQRWRPNIGDREWWVPDEFGGLRRLVRESIAGAIRAGVGRRLGLMWFGQHDVDWLAACDARRPGIPRAVRPWSDIARSCGWWWPREDRCVLTERPVALRLKDERLHCADGPAVAYPDGWELYFWDGTRVPAWVIREPTVDRIAAEPNIEVRRCAIERLGWADFISQANLTVVGRAPDPGNPGHELVLYDLPSWDEPSRLLLAVNGSVERDGTRRRYGLRVPDWFDDPIDAAGWTYGLSGAHYAQLQRRT
ncbi:DUF6745 domain-containing protein [Actinokineospora sp. NPDC004072]